MHTLVSLEQCRLHTVYTRMADSKAEHMQAESKQARKQASKCISNLHAWCNRAALESKTIELTSVRFEYR